MSYRNFSAFISVFMNLKYYDPNELSKHIKASQRGKNDKEKNEQIKKSITNIEFMYDELKNNY